RLKCARHNAEVYGVADRIEFIHGDFMQLAPHLKADVVFLSPPWGGPEYNQSDTYDLDLMEPVNGLELYKVARRITPDIAYFLPRNCEPDQIGQLDPGRNVEIEMNYLFGYLKAITAYFGELVGDTSDAMAVDNPEEFDM
ncbi:RNA methylase protein, partial [Tieghemiomyces parasiticus]